METINNATEAIKKTIWGDDANTGTTNNNGGGITGNILGSGTHSEIHKSMIDDKVTETKFSGRVESDPDAEGAYQPDQSQHDPNFKPQGPTSTGGQPQGANVTGDNRNTNQNPFSSSNEPNTGFGGSAGAQPSVGADPSSGQQDRSNKHQGAEKPSADPDAQSSTGSGSSGVSGAGSMGGGAGGMKLPDSDNQSKGEGTGQKYEKSTGLAAEGGDFDATRPGAAREAARLMDEKGIAHGGKPGDSGEPQKEKKWYGVDHSGFGGHGSHQNKRLSFSKSSDNKTDEHDETDEARESNYTYDTSNTTSDTYTKDTSGATAETGEKPGLAQKIKDKLHHGNTHRTAEQPTV